jgi:hypothetical protein
MLGFLVVLILVAVLVQVVPMDGQVRKTFNIIIIVMAVLVLVFGLFPISGLDFAEWPRKR